MSATWYDARGRIYTPSPVNRQHPLNRRRAFWLLSLPGLSGGARYWDLLGRNHGVGANVAWKSGQPGGFASLLFAGGTGLVTCPRPLPTPPMSVAVWAKPSTPGLICTLFAAPSPGGLQWRIESNGALGLIRQAQANIGAGTGGAVATGRWSRCMATFAANGDFRFYVNGTPDSGGNASPSYSATGMVLGQNPSSAGEAYYGLLADATAWSRVLTPRDARDDYALSRRGYPRVLNRA